MNKLVDFERLNIFTTKVYDIDTISRVLPQYIINTFTSFLVITSDNRWERLYKNGDKLFDFTITLGLNIKEGIHNRIDDVIIEYFEECFSIQNGIKYNVILGNNEKKYFSNICDEFMYRGWDNIIDPLCKGLNILGFSGKVNNIKLYGDS